MPRRPDPLPAKATRRDMLRLGAAGSAFLFAPALARGPGGGPWAQAEKIAARVQAPTFPDRTVSVLASGAAADGETADTVAFARAIEQCAEDGGGRVLVPPGRYRTGAIHLRSNVELHLERGAHILFSTDPADYPLVLTRYEGVELYNYSPLIYARDAENVAVTGQGILHGGADTEHWWPWCGAERFGWREGEPSQTADRDTLFEMAERGVPVEERVFGTDHFLRPSFIEFYRCANVAVRGVRLEAAPFWNLHPVLCRNVLVEDVTVAGHGPNNDGCNPESVDGMVIQRCHFDTGDDCIAIKSGRNADGRRLSVPARNILVRRCEMKAGHGGVVIGSEISGGAHSVFVEDCRMDSPDLWYALRFKNNAMRGGVIEDVFVRNVDVGRVGRAAITCDFNYEEGADGPFTPVLRRLVVDGLRVEHAIRVLDLQGLPGAPVRDIVLRDCAFGGVIEPSIIAHTEGLRLEDVRVNGRPVRRL
ncbi:glycoside hydrolase family 28 protein [Parvularcula oceani]|uniref:glycoside hydrolase family 28 protein n=1 Tax=Parvularcula oceani TaxID=1247963 RepID=UPI000690E5DB|nr:glycoside hydrolase family 28 protein [Parvularcula oceani]